MNKKKKDVLNYLKPESTHKLEITLSNGVVHVVRFPFNESGDMDLRSFLNRIDGAKPYDLLHISQASNPNIWIFKHHIVQIQRSDCL